MSQTVVPAVSNTLVTSSLNPSVAGQLVTFTVTVTSTVSGTPAGLVTLRDNGNLLGTVVLDGSGQASFGTNALSAGPHTITADYTGSTPPNTGILIQTVNPAPTATTTIMASSQSPSAVGQAVTFTATVTGATPTGTVTFRDGASDLGAPVTLSGGVATFTTASLAPGGHSITAAYSGDANNATSTSAPLIQTVNQAATTTALTSSKNPTALGEPVTFTATVTGGSGTPTGTVNFFDGGTAIGSATLSGGAATLITSSLAVGSHSITAAYVGTANFTASTSPVLVQAVSTPADSLKLRAMQVLAAPVAAQVSGQAISGAIDSAISEGFSDGGALAMPSGSGVRFNFAGDPDGKPANTATRSTDPFSSANGSFASTGRGFGMRPSSPADSTSPSRVDDAFGSLASGGGFTKAPPRYVAQRDWLGWAEVRGATLDHWGNNSGVGTVTGVPVLYGTQVNLLAGLTRRLMPNFLVGVLGGYETFDYRSDALQGRLKGDGWTVGSYLGWRLATSLRFDAAVAYSDIGYDGTAGTAAGSFSGHRWLVSSGLTGTYQGWGVQIEPSARVYALWEREDAYTDSLGTLQAQRNFSAGRASGGVKITYPIGWSSTVALAPYGGLYGDYYFNADDAGVATAAAPAIPTPIVLDGWSVRAIGGLAARFGNGAQVAIGGERSGIGGNFGLWTYRARASVPFGAQ